MVTACVYLLSNTGRFAPYTSIFSNTCVYFNSRDKFENQPASDTCHSCLGSRPHDPVLFTKSGWTFHTLSYTYNVPSLLLRLKYSLQWASHYIRYIYNSVNPGWIPILTPKYNASFFFVFCFFIFFVYLCKLSIDTLEGSWSEVEIKHLWQVVSPKKKVKGSIHATFVVFQKIPPF